MKSSSASIANEAGSVPLLAQRRDYRAFNRITASNARRCSEPQKVLFAVGPAVVPVKSLREFDPAASKRAQGSDPLLGARFAQRDARMGVKPLAQGDRTTVANEAGSVPTSLQSAQNSTLDYWTTTT